MKPFLPMAAMLLILLPSVASHAQTGNRAASAPPRKPATSAKPATPQKASIPAKLPTTQKPASTAPSTAPQRTGSSSTGTVTQAEGRTNSTALPAPVQTQTTPAPQPTAVSSRRRTSGARSARGTGGVAYEKGDNLLNIGVGLSSYYYGNPLGISFEVGVHEDISVGGQIDYNSGNYGDYYYNSSRWRYTAMYFGVRGSYHFNRILQLNTRKFDLYAGVGLGYRTFRWNDSAYGYGYDYRSGISLNGFIGGKYYFTDKFGAFVELGYTGLSYSRIGLSAKF